MDVLTKYKIVIFCDSEFFHGKDWEIKRPKLLKSKNTDECIKVIEETIFQNQIENMEIDDDEI